ncbi:hypothetical protein BHE74_00025194 [Ensete ventricosum]|nr:hypothetical protein BHE74_00025194 [Ensete ventricosum]
MKQKVEVVLFLCTTEDDAGDAERRGKKLSLDSRGLPSTERVARVDVSECGCTANANCWKTLTTTTESGRWR